MEALTWPGTAVSPLDEPIKRLLERCLTGEEAAYQELYAQYAGMIYRLTYSLLQHKEDAEEVLQDSFEYAFRKLHQYDANKSAFKTWLYQIAISRCHNKRRRQWLPTFSLSQLLGNRLFGGDDITDTQTPTPEELFVLTAQQRLVWDALAKLSPKLRETAVLRYYEGLSYGEIGEVLNIPAKTAESRMRLAHTALRDLLQDVYES